MDALTELNLVERKLISEFTESDEISTIAKLPVFSLFKLLRLNLFHSINYRKMLEKIQISNTCLDVKHIVGKLLEEESEPKDHIDLHLETLNALSVVIDSIDCPDAITNFSKHLSDLSKSGDPLELLCFLRLGCEILPGFFYKEVSNALSSHCFPIEDYEFYSLHAALDRQTGSIGDIVTGGHADFFSRPIGRRIDKQPDQLPLAISGLESSKQLRLEMLSGMLERVVS